MIYLLVNLLEGMPQIILKQLVVFMVKYQDNSMSSQDLMNLFMINVLNHKIQLPDEHKNIDIRIVFACVIIVLELALCLHPPFDR